LFLFKCFDFRMNAVFMAGSLEGQLRKSPGRKTSNINGVAHRQQGLEFEGSDGGLHGRLWGQDAVLCR
jgi:hypothetical protein